MYKKTIYPLDSLVGILRDCLETYAHIGFYVLVLLIVLGRPQYKTCLIVLGVPRGMFLFWFPKVLKSFCFLVFGLPCGFLRFGLFRVLGRCLEEYDHSGLRFKNLCFLILALPQRLGSFVVCQRYRF